MALSTGIKDYLTLHFLVVIWSFTAILGLLISIPALEIVFYRTLIAAASIGLFFLWKKKKIRLPLNSLLKILGTGFIIGIHWILFFWAAQVSTASVCLAGMATTSLWTALFEPLANKQRIKAFEIFLGLIVIAGLYVIFKFEFGYWLGLSMAIGSAMLSAVFTVINGKLTKSHGPYTLTFYEMIGACLFTVMMMPIYSHFFTESGLQLVPEAMDWLWLLILAVVCTVYAFSVSVELMRRLTAFAINLTINLEPVYGIMLAVLIFGDKEKMTPGFYVGTLVILLAVLVYPFYQMYQKRKMSKRMLGT